MIKSIFVSPKNIAGIENSNANHLIVHQKGLDSKNLGKLKKLNTTLGISINSFGSDGCPPNPGAQEKLFNRLDKALRLKPDEIWIDHFRFDGHWEGVKLSKIPDNHEVCEFCEGKNRVDTLKYIARDVKKYVGKVKLGYFVVPFKNYEVPALISSLGQDHKILGEIFDMTSPMLYHQMIDKPISYISEYTNWMHAQIQKPILPIVQLKYMPDNLEDKLSEQDIREEYEEAIKLPSEGVCFFSWNHALEKDKTRIIKKLFA